MIRIFVLSFLFSFSFFSVSGQSGEVLGVFSVSSSSGADPTPTVVGKFNSTMGFTALSVDTGELLIVRQVYGGAHRRKVYEVTGVSGSSPLTLTLLLVSGTSGGPFPTGAQAICRPLTSGVALDVPNVSQELESYIINYSFSILEGLAIDTSIVSNDSLFLQLYNGDLVYTGSSTSNSISASYQSNDSIFVVSADTTFTGFARPNGSITKTYSSGGNIYIITTDGDTLLCGTNAQVTLSPAAPVNPATYLSHVDTLGIDSLYFNSDGVWELFHKGGNAGAFVHTTTDFVTFEPPGHPAIGSLIWNKAMGSLYRKVGPAVFTPTSQPNGRNVLDADAYEEAESLSGWDLSLNTRANLTVTGAVGDVSIPGNFLTAGEGLLAVVVIENTTGSSIDAAFDTIYVDYAGAELDTISIPANSKYVFEFSVYSDQHGNKFSLTDDYRTNTGGGTVFNDIANGIDIVESGSVTIAPDITELTYVVPVGADSLLIWDASANAHRRTSVADILLLPKKETQILYGFTASDSLQNDTLLFYVVQASEDTKVLDKVTLYMKTWPASGSCTLRVLKNGVSAVSTVIPFSGTIGSLTVDFANQNINAGDCLELAIESETALGGYGLSFKWVYTE